MRVTASKLREDIYNILDRALERGEPIEVLRKGRVLRNALVGDPQSIVHMDWLRSSLAPQVLRC